MMEPPAPGALRLAGWLLLATGVTPEVFVPLRQWTGILFAIFACVGYASVACLGAATLRAELGPAWLRWATVVCGLTAGYVVGYNVPFIMYVPFAALGVALLRG
jgi:hypothetical protein